MKLDKNKILVDEEDRHFLDEYTWYNSNGYALSFIKVNGLNKTIYLHRLIMGVTDTKVCIDHIIPNKLDNRKNNLRICTKAQNLCNRGKGKYNKSGYKGVHKDKKSWAVQVKHKHIGNFKTIREAALAYNKAVIEIRGEFARPNLIK